MGYTSAAQAGLAHLTAFTPNMLLTCRRAGNPWQSPVCWSGTRGLAFAWGPCCSPRRATRLVCPSCMLVNGTRWWDGVRTRAHSRSLSFLSPSLSLSPSHKHRLPESSECDVTRSVQEAGGWWVGGVVVVIEEEGWGVSLSQEANEAVC